MENKPWLKQPGQCFDKKGYPIYPGDLLKSPHFRTRRKRYYLYHVATYKDGAMHMTPACWLHPENVKGGGQCLLSDGMASDCEIIHGHGPGDCLGYEDRPRRKPNKEQPQ